MALLLADAQTYLQSLAPVKQPEPVCTIDTATVRYFAPYRNTNLHYADPSLVPHDIDFADPKIEILLNKICSAIEFETDNGVYFTASEVLEQMDDDLGTDLVADVLATAVDNVLAVFSPVTEKPTLLQSVKSSLLFDNSWEIFDNIIGKFADPAFPDAMVLLLEDALRMVGIAPQVHTEFEHMAEMILGMASGHLSQYWLFGENRIENNDHAKLPEELRPATIYRRWVKPVRFLAQSFKAAKSLLKEIILEQTLPLSELDAPDWVDQYTMELDPTAEKDFVSIKAGGVFSASKTQAMEDLGWDDQTINTFVSAQESFNDGDEAQEEWVGELGHEEAEPMFMRMQHDFQSTERLKDLRELISKETFDCKERMKRIVSENWKSYAPQLAKLARSHFPKVKRDFLLEACEHTLAYPENQSKKHSWLAFKIWDTFSLEIIEMKKKYKLPEKGKAEWRDAFEASEEAALFLETLQSFITSEESPVDVALLFLSLQNDFGFTPEIASMIKLRTSISSSTDLYQYIEANEEDILANLSGDAVSNQETSDEEIQEFCDETLEMLVSQGLPGAKDVTKTPAYIRGYMNAAFNSATGDTATCIAAGWDAWRQEKSPAANLAYHKAALAGISPKELMKSVFWPIVNKAERKLKEGRIVGTTSTGLTLSNGRKIDWHIAALKFKADELLLSADDIIRLRDRLVKGGYGKELVAVLA